MKKHLICLANSYKHSGRCLRGIEIELIDKRYIVIKHPNGSPKWIRPVSKSKHGELTTYETEDFQLLDIIEIDGVVSCPKGAPSENVYYKTLKKVTRCRKELSAADNF